MRDDVYLKVGSVFFVIAILGLGALHLITGSFTDEFFPVAASFPFRMFFAYLTGSALVIAGMLILIKRYQLYGALLTAIILLIFLVFLHIPKLIMNLYDSGEYTSISENFMFLAGALMLGGNILREGGHQNRAYWLFTVGKYMFALTLFDFGMEHFISEAFVVSIIPAWIPAKVFWAYFVMCAFFAASLSIFINKRVRMAALLLSLMFFLWVCLMHLPGVIANVHSEFAWTNLFVPIGVSGIALLLAGSAGKTFKKSVK